MGKRIVRCGEATAGQAAKICNNMILGISMIAVCEAFVLGERLGLSHQALFDVASTSSGQCWSLTSYCPVPGPVPASPANAGYKPGFAAALMLKDLRLSRRLPPLRVPTPPWAGTRRSCMPRSRRLGMAGRTSPASSKRSAPGRAGPGHRLAPSQRAAPASPVRPGTRRVLAGFHPAS